MSGYLRLAAEQDMELLFQWTNDPMVRKNSFSTEEISYEEHKEWYRKLLNRCDCRQYIYMLDEEPIGQVRIKLVEDTAEIGYSISPEKRHMGHGKKLLSLLAGQMAVDFPEVKKLVGKVKPENIASQRAFRNAGYEEKYYAYEMFLQE